MNCSPYFQPCDIYFLPLVWFRKRSNCGKRRTKPWPLFWKIVSLARCLQPRAWYILRWGTLTILFWWSILSSNVAINPSLYHYTVIPILNIISRSQRPKRYFRKSPRTIQPRVLLLFRYYHPQYFSIMRVSICMLCEWFSSHSWHGADEYPRCYP